MKQYEHFEGTIGNSSAESVPWWPTPTHSKENASEFAAVLNAFIATN